MLCGHEDAVRGFDMKASTSLEKSLNVYTADIQRHRAQGYQVELFSPRPKFYIYIYI